MTELTPPKPNADEAKGAEALKRALVAVRDLRARLDAVEQARHEPIAIVGMGCRLPGGVEDTEAFWRLLREGREAVGEVPKERWDIEEFYDPDPEAPGRTYARTAAFVNGVDLFDAPFFGISPREALSMDPQQRLLLEVAWEALERAGQSPEELRGSDTGVFIGISTSDYSQLVQRLGGDRIDPYTGTGGAFCVAAGRISYTLGLHGPNLAVDTACSSALVAIQLAVQSLRSGACPMALAGGVNLMLAPEATVYLSKVRALSTAGHCRTFDAAADGYVRGEGCGVLVLKRLSDARAHGDTVLAVIRGAAVNHDGKSGGLTVPNAAAQQLVLRQALADAGVAARDVAYVEAHGTGTPLGDPIEVRALMAVMGEGRSADQPLVLGSAKTNIGHLEAAAGVAGLMKVVLSLQHGEIPPHLHFDHPSPHIDWDTLPVTVPKTLQGWPESRKIGGVSSFGFSGTNAHVILEEAPAEESVAPGALARPLHVLTLSATSEEALVALAARYRASLAAPEGPALADVCFTANAGRSHFPHRLAVVAASLAQVAEALAGLDHGEAPGVLRGTAPLRRAPKVAFLFTGQGSQYAGMGRSLYETQPTFKKALDRCSEITAGRLGKPLLDVMFGLPGTDGLVDRTGYTQPCLFALEWALAELWRSWGVEPGAVMGHSVGEYVAAAVSGVLSLEDALGLIIERARLMESLPAGGAMVAVQASEERVRTALGSDDAQVSVAAVNGPSSVVVSGASEPLRRVVDTLEKAGIKSQALQVSHAFHSALLDPMLADLERAASKVERGAPSIGLVSNLTGRFLIEGEATPVYWRRHARETVRFADSMRVLWEKGYDVFVELGPHPVLLGMARACVAEGSGSWVPSLRKGREDWPQMLEGVAKLYVGGVAIDWAGFDGDYHRRRVVLPTYPFQRQRYWVEAAEAAPARPSRDTSPGHPLLGTRVDSPLAELLFESRVSAAAPPFLKDHAFLGRVIYPAAAYVEMALAAAEASGLGAIRLEDLAVEEPLVFRGEEARTLQSIARPGSEGTSLEFFSQAGSEDEKDGAWKRHASVRLVPRSEGEAPKVSLPEMQGQCPEVLDVVALYESYRTRGVEYGPGFRAIESVWRGEGQALGRIRVADVARAEDGAYRLHPALLDAALQLLGAAVPEEEGGGGTLYLPTGLRRLTVHGEVPTSLWAQARVTQLEAARLTADLCLFDESGRVFVEVDGLLLRRATRAALERSTAAAVMDWLYETRWPTGLEAEATDPEVGTWLVLMDAAGVGEALGGSLEQQGSRCVRVWPGETFGRRKDGAVTVRPEHLPDFERLLQEEAAEPLRGVVHLWGVEPAPADLGTWGPGEAMARSCASALHLVKALAGRPEGPTRVWLATRGARSIENDTADVAVAASALWGLGRTIALEHPELRCVCVDLDPAEANGAEHLLRELGQRGREDQVAYRQGLRRLARLGRARRSGSPAAEPPPGQSLQLQISERGVLDNLRLVPLGRRAPEPGEVEVKVRTAGLNFRDVLNALGMYAGQAGLLGHEFAGTVVAAGAGVSHLCVGDEVMGIAEGTFATYVTTGAAGVVRKPGRLSDEEAATIPMAFLTAHYALIHLARMARGERVLIHSAAGGVGMAAIQIARMAGAEIFATAGNPEKRERLRSLGIEHVMDSRSTKFADEIKERTGGAGIDVVLNFLTGDAIPASLSLLRTGGRFLEIGKAGIWEPERVKEVYPHVRYHVIYLGEVGTREPELIQSMFSEIAHDLQAAKLEPLPLRAFPMRDAALAFRHMAAARHIGKVVIGIDETGREGVGIRSDATYLLTGGLGGLGLRTARWLVDQGARNLVLVGRRGPSAKAAAAIGDMEAQGAVIAVMQADVSQPDDVARVLAEIAAGTAPLRGVIHAAGVLDDAPLVNTTFDRFAPVLGAKALGAWNLHVSTREIPLDFFVLYSSVASVLGSAGQGSYAAANAFLDGLAHRRRGEGRTGLSVNWGPWAEVGMAAAQDEKQQRRRRDSGADPIAPGDAFLALEELLERGCTQATVLPIRWGTFLRALVEVPPLLAEIGGEAKGGTERHAAARGSDLLRQISETSESERADVLLAHVRQEALKVLGLAPGSTLNPDQPLSDLGLDSLMAVELRNALGAALGTALPPTLLFDYPTVNALVGLLADKIPAMRKASTVASEPAKEKLEHEALVAEIGQLSESEVEAAIARELGTLGK